MNQKNWGDGAHFMPTSATTSLTLWPRHLHKMNPFSSPVLCQIDIHVTLSGAKFVVPPQASMHSLALPRQVASFNTSDTQEPHAQVRQTLKTHHSHRYTHLLLNSWDDKDNSRQFQHRIPWKRLGRSKRPLCTRTFWLDRLGQLYPHFERSDYLIQADCLINIYQFENSSRTSPSLDRSDWLIRVDRQIFLNKLKNFFPIKAIWLAILRWSSNLLQSGQEILHIWAILLSRSM